ncbi:Thromboxane-A synthase [Geranomyces variabilis]|uniref:Thromboxane-A synthase n=1 Tax=Geranomyces variabilis TaxID=109894 RepID=A0AAD5XLX5_9FUNG|nr:Thromboxane-A synthase [Geranomyces variabilis]
MGLVDSLPWHNPAFTAAVILAAIGLAYYYYYSLPTSHHPRVPRPACSLPILGTSLAFHKYAKAKHFYKWTREQTKLLGPFWDMNVIGFRPVCSDAREVRKMLTDGDAYYRGNDPRKAFIDIAQYPLFIIPSGPVWKHHRKLIQPAFAPSNIRKVFPVSIEKADKMLAIMGKLTAKNPTTAAVNLYDCFQRVTLDIIGEVALGGHQFNSLDELLYPPPPSPPPSAAGQSASGASSSSSSSSSSLTSLFEAFEKIVQAVGSRFGLPEWTWFLSNSSRKEIAPAAAAAQELARSMIDKRRRELNEEVAQGIVRDKKDYDVMDRVLIPNADGELLSTDEIVDEVIGFVLAGHETSSNAVTFALWHLMMDKNVMDKLMDEILRVLGPRGEPTAEMLKEMPYLDMVFKESLRLKSPVPAFQRSTVRDTVICGYHVPKDTGIMINVSSIHIDPELWGPDAEEFIPERWEDKAKMSDLEKLGAYLPFGGGPMMCVGMKVAIPEIKILMVRLLQHFEPSLRPGQDFSWTIDAVYDGYQTGAKKPIYGMPSSTDVSPQKPGEGGIQQAFNYQQQHYQQQQAAQAPNPKKRALISDYFAPGQQ